MRPIYLESPPRRRGRWPRDLAVFVAGLLVAGAVAVAHEFRPPPPAQGPYLAREECVVAKSKGGRR